MGEIVRAIRKIQSISLNSQLFLLKYSLANFSFLSIYGVIFALSFPWQLQLLAFSSIFLVHSYYLHFMKPLVRQVKRGTIPLLVFDDLNKL